MRSFEVLKWCGMGFADGGGLFGGEGEGEACTPCRLMCLAFYNTYVSIFNLDIATIFS